MGMPACTDQTRNALKSQGKALSDLMTQMEAQKRASALPRGGQ